jgi:hypothetical protein
MDEVGMRSATLDTPVPDDLAGKRSVSRHTAQLVRVPEAARITGLPQSLIRKSFMREDKRPRNIPAPPPHRRIGRAVYILADELSAWVQRLGEPPVSLPGDRHRSGRPTVAQRIARREREGN